MSSGWDIYWVLLYSAGVVFLFPVGLRFCSWLFTEKKIRPADPLAKNDQIQKHTRVHPRAILSFNVGAMLLVSSMVLIPCVASLQKFSTSGDEQDLFLSLLAVIVVASSLALGLFYASKKGDLAWTRSYRRKR